MKNPKTQKKVTTQEGLANFVQLSPLPGELHRLCFVYSKDDTVTHTTLQEAVKEAVENGKTLWGSVKASDLTLPIRDGDLKASTYPEFKNSWYVNVKSKYRPGMIDSNRQEIIDPAEIYSGCFVRLSLNVYTYNNSGNRGVGFGLNNILKTRDGTRLSSRGNPVSDFFEDVSEELLA
jgi:hypothetical protein